MSPTSPDRALFDAAPGPTPTGGQLSGHHRPGGVASPQPPPVSPELRRGRVRLLGLYVLYLVAMLLVIMPPVVLVVAGGMTLVDQLLWQEPSPETSFWRWVRSGLVSASIGAAVGGCLGVLILHTGHRQARRRAAAGEDLAALSYHGEVDLDVDADTAWQRCQAALRSLGPVQVWWADRERWELVAETGANQQGRSFWRDRSFSPGELLRLRLHTLPDGRIRVALSSTVLRPPAVVPVVLFVLAVNRLVLRCVSFRKRNHHDDRPHPALRHDVENVDRLVQALRAG